MNSKSLELVDRVIHFLTIYGPQPTEEIQRHALKKEAANHDRSWSHKFLHSVARQGYIKHLGHNCIVEGSFVAGSDESMWGI